MTFVVFNDFDFVETLIDKEKKVILILEGYLISCPYKN